MLRGSCPLPCASSAPSPWLPAPSIMGIRYRVDPSFSVVCADVPLKKPAPFVLRTLGEKITKIVAEIEIKASELGLSY